MRLKRIKTTIATMTLIAMSSITAFAGQWKQDHIGWWWQEDNGSYPINCWKWIDGNNDGISECYYFNETGYMLASTVTPDGYLVDCNGAWIENGIVQTKINEVNNNVEVKKLTNEVYTIIIEGDREVDKSQMTPDEKAKYEEYLTLAKKVVEEEAEEYIKYKNGQNPDYQINDFNEEGMSMTINGEDIKTAPYSEDIKQVIANSMWKILFLMLAMG